MYRVFIAILAILITNIAFALDSEYKNSLNGIDLTKSSDTSYSINLFTAKEFSEPVKVIKKSDLNYYILLPETKNTIQKAFANNPDIRSIDTQSFPYAGSDVKNGYTKVNINTTKPLNFTVNTRIKTASVAQAASIKEIKEEIPTKVSDTKVQKKNLVQETKKTITDNQITKTTPTSVQTNTVKKDIITQKKDIIPLKKTQKNQNTSILKTNPIKEEQKKQIDKKQNSEPIKKETSTVQKETKEEKPLYETIKEEQEEFQKQLREEIQQQEETNEAVYENTSNYEDTKAEEEQIEDIQKVKKEELLTEIKSSIIFNLAILKYKVQSKLLEYGLSIKELLLMILAGILSFIIVILVLNKNKETDMRLKSKSDFADKTNAKATLTPKKSKPVKNQHFIFDKNVHQTGFIAPATGNERRNFELSSYEPSLQPKATATIEPYRTTPKTSDYDIIQNILREDTFIDLSNDDTIATQPKEHKNSITSMTQEVPKTMAPKVAKKEVSNSTEPQVLSNVEIAPSRGFMCVSYNNSISVLGYIFDDVFALYNFQQPKLENYNIRFRLSEKTKYGANFIVRIDKTKLLVSVTKSSMSLEVAF